MIQNPFVDDRAPDRVARHRSGEQGALSAGDEVGHRRKGVESGERCFGGVGTKTLPEHQQLRLGCHRPTGLFLIDRVEQDRTSGGRRRVVDQKRDPARQIRILHTHDRRVTRDAALPDTFCVEGSATPGSVVLSAVLYTLLAHETKPPPHDFAHHDLGRECDDHHGPDESNRMRHAPVEPAVDAPHLPPDEPASGSQDQHEHGRNDDARQGIEYDDVRRSHEHPLGVLPSRPYHYHGDEHHHDNQRARRPRSAPESGTESAPDAAQTQMNEPSEHTAKAVAPERQRKPPEHDTTKRVHRKPVDEPTSFSSTHRA